MAGLFPRLTPEGRRAMMRLALVVGAGGAALAAWRRDLAGAGVILTTLTVLGGVYLWSHAGTDEGDHEDGKRRDGGDGHPGGDPRDGNEGHVAGRPDDEHDESEDR